MAWRRDGFIPETKNCEWAISCCGSDFSVDGVQLEVSLFLINHCYIEWHTPVGHHSSEAYYNVYVQRTLKGLGAGWSENSSPAVQRFSAPTMLQLARPGYLPAWQHCQLCRWRSGDGCRNGRGRHHESPVAHAYACIRLERELRRTKAAPQMQHDIVNRHTGNLQSTGEPQTF